MASGWVVGDASNAIVGIEINANHLKSASKGFVMGITRPIKMGKKLHRWSTEIFDENEEMICVSRLTTLVKTIKNG